jgi:large subunit ribosomal protein L37Ae
MAKTKIVKSAGRFGVRYGQSVRRRTAAIEAKQKKKQECLFCNGRARRTSKGIWECDKCGKRFAGHAYFLEKEISQIQVIDSGKKSKSLKKENPIINK